MVAQGLQSDRTPQVLSLMVAQLEFIGRYLITDSDQQAYRSWVHNLLAPIAADVGWEKKPGENEEMEGLRGDLMRGLGGVAHDPRNRGPRPKTVGASVGRSLFCRSRARRQCAFQSQPQPATPAFTTRYSSI